MEEIAKKLTNKIAIELNLDNEKKEVIEYGAFALVQTCIFMILMLVLSSIFGVVLQAIILSIVACSLRKYSGGVHVSTLELCTAISLVVCIFGAVSAKFVGYKINTIYLIGMLGIIVFIWAFYIINKYAPVDTPNKPIKTLKKKQRMKKKSIFVLIICLIVVLGFILQYILKNNKIYFTYIFCIYIGILWQCFTLTNIGHIVIRRIDLFFYNIAKRFKGGYNHEKN